MKRIVMAGVLCCVAGAAQAADDIDNLGALAQGEFKKLSEDLGSSLSYKAVAPAEPLGITGFDLGIEFSSTALENKSIFNTACSGCDVDNLIIPKLHLHKGLPLNLDVGLVYSSVPSSNIKLAGVELRYAILEGGMASPALALRGTYSKLSGVDQLDFSTRGVELSVSKGFAMFTPYGGVGQNWVTSTPNVTGLEEETFSQSKYYVGLNMNLGLLNIDVEADDTGGAQTLSGKLGLRF